MFFVVFCFQLVAAERQQKRAEMVAESNATRWGGWWDGNLLSFYVHSGVNKDPKILNCLLFLLCAVCGV